MVGASGCISLHRTEGRAALDQFRYQDALDHFGQILEKRPEDPEALSAMADAFSMINRHDAARAQWQKLDSLQALPPNALLPYAQTLMALGAYKEALGVIDRPFVRQDSGNLAQWAVLRASCTRVLAAEVPHLEVDIRAVEVPGLKTSGGIDFHESGFVLTGQTARPTFNPDDPYTGLSNADLYRGALSNNPYQFQVTPWSDLNGPFHDGYAAFDATGLRVAWSRNNTGTGQSLRVNTQQTSTIQIYFAIADSAGSWSRPFPFPFNEEDYNFAHPTWFPSGEGILFASDLDGPGACGGMDLWYTLRNGNFWSEPVNMGPTINTPGDELFPFIHGTDSLFFSSDGHPTLGGLDLLLCVRAQGWEAPPHLGWSDPIALPSPLNSPADDFGLRLDSGLPGSGYLTSDRQGLDRLYRFGMNTSNPIPPSIAPDSLVLATDRSLTDPAEGSFLPDGVLSDSILPTPASDQRTEASMDTQPATRSSDSGSSDSLSTPTASTLPTTISPSSASAPDPTTNSSSSTSKDSTLTLPPPAGMPPPPSPPSSAEIAAGVPASTGTPISWPDDFVLPEIYWDLDKSNVREKDEHPLQELAQLLIDNPSFHLEIQSHCDARGTFEYNVALAQRRAEAVKNQLLDLGVPANQMHSIGFGEYRLRNKCADGVKCTEAEHQYNRRTEFQLIRPNTP
jgi:outer membrane protein OmpA-like peptidoglycan-associated protein